MKFSCVSLNDLFEIVDWRNAFRETLRTGHFTTKEQQQNFHDFLIKNPHKYRFFSYKDPSDKLLAVCALTDISIENRNAEISLLVNPSFHGKGIGKDVFNLLLNEAFDIINLSSVYAETYTCNPGINFWEKMSRLKKSRSTYIPNRKFFNGKYYDSLYIVFFNDKLSH